MTDDDLNDRDYWPDDESPYDTGEDIDPESAYAALSEFDSAAGDTVSSQEPFAPEPDSAAPQAATDEEERLRQPRAQNFRRRLHNQISMLPLALYLLTLGGFLIAREREVEGLPDLSVPALAGITVLAAAFVAIFHALVSGRRERGLLFLGLWIWSAAGAIAVLVYGVDEQADAAEWWPVLLWSLSLALVLTYVLERGHDARLVLFSVVVLVAGTTAYAITSDRIDDRALTDAADYWPLLLALAGVGLLPLVFRRRTG